MDIRKLMEGVTPGPWEAVRCGPAAPDRWNVQAELGCADAGFRKIRTIDQVLDYCGAEEAKANARLIAAAPYLAQHALALEEENARLRAIGTKLLAIFDHPTAHVSYLEADELRAALSTTIHKDTDNGTR